MNESINVSKKWKPRPAGVPVPPPNKMSSISDTLLAEYRLRVTAAEQDTLRPLIADEQFPGLWRNSAMEAIPYTEDFPEPILVLPELFDGCRGQGTATKITITIKVYADGIGVLTVADNGKGIQNLSRFKRWAATKSVDNLHRNGHGMKKCMTKWAPDFQLAVWAVVFRNKNRNATVIRYPYNGSETHVDDEEADAEILKNCGTEIHIVFNSKVLCGLNTAEKLAQSIQELIETRHLESVFASVEFKLDVEWGDSHVVKNSKDPENPWHSFRYFVEQEVDAGNAVLEKDVEGTSNGSPWHLWRFKLTIDGKKVYALKARFPRFGTKTPGAQRVNIALMDRVIEAMPYYKLAGKPSAHPTDNGTIVFVEFAGVLETLPQPCTTKVLMYPQDPIFMQFKDDVRRILNPAAVEVPLPAPVAPPRTILGHVADAFAAALAPAVPLPPAPAPGRKNVTKDVMCRAFDVDAHLEDGSLVIVYDGETFNMAEWKVTDIRFARR